MHILGVWDKIYLFWDFGPKSYCSIFRKNKDTETADSLLELYWQGSTYQTILFLISEIFGAWAQLPYDFLILRKNTQICFNYFL